jgi:K+-sensing histidine kinase KdpD
MFGSHERLGHLEAWLVGLLVPLAAAAVMATIRTHTQPSNLALIMVLVVAVSVVPGYRLPALAAGLSAGLWFDFFLTRPYGQFSIQRSSDIQTTVLLAVVGVVVGEIAARRRKAHAIGRLAQDEVVGLYVVAQMLSAGARPQVVLDTVAEQLKDLLLLDSCRFDPSGPTSTDPLIDRAGELEYERADWSVGRDGLPQADVSLPVDSAGETVGRFVLRAPKIGVPLGSDRLLAAVALSDLAGAALGHQNGLRSQSEAQTGR